MDTTSSTVPGSGPDSQSQTETAITVAQPSEPATGSPSAPSTHSPVVRTLPSHFNYDYAEHADGSRSLMVDEQLLPSQAAPPEEVELRTQQQIALAALLRTGSISEASERADVARSTIHRWMKSDAKFKEALKRCEQRQAICVRQELLAIAGQAAYNVRAAIGQGDLRASLTVLRQLGILDRKAQEEPEDPPAPPETEPEPPAKPALPQRSAIYVP